MASPVPAKSQPLHNFSLPHLKWKNHRTSPPRHPSRRPSPLHKQSPIQSDHESADVTNQRKRTSSSSSNKICIKLVSTSASEALEDDESLQKTWNLRPRRPPMNHNVTKIGSSSVTENKSVGNKEVVTENNKAGVNDDKQKFAIALTRDEIEEDIFMLTGMKPARRPKKRPRTVQKQLDTLFPGLWLVIELDPRWRVVLRLFFGKGSKLSSHEITTTITISCFLKALESCHFSRFLTVCNAKLQLDRLKTFHSKCGEVLDDRLGQKLAHPSLYHSFRRHPRGGLELTQVEELAKVINPVVLTQSPDSWSWTLNNSGGYTVASSRNMIDSRLLPKGDLKTRWIRYVPNKVNTFAWKVMTNSLPTRFNISRRGIDIESLSCVNCDVGIETNDHLFFACNH
ncbi:RNA-directed DNA polymerase, eukaryota [Tanacetum coccineum]